LVVLGHDVVQLFGYEPVAALKQRIVVLGKLEIHSSALYLAGGDLNLPK